MRADARKNYEHILNVARNVVTVEGADASLRDIARQAEVGLGTLYRHFPSREALLEALLRKSFDELTAKASELEKASSPDTALLTWLQDVVICTRKYQGVITAMMAAKEDPNSALHNSCVNMRSAGASLLERAQLEGLARGDMSGDDLFSLAAALAWLGESTISAERSQHLFNIISSSIFSR